MKTLFASIATLVFVGSVSASNESFIYHGFEVGNGDLYGGYSISDHMTAVQPGIGDRSDRSRSPTTRATDSYDHFVMHNEDTYSGEPRSEKRSATRPGIGDSSDRMSRRNLSGNDSYSAWVEGNPDQESSF